MTQVLNRHPIVQNLPALWELVAARAVHQSSDSASTQSTPSPLDALMPNGDTISTATTVGYDKDNTPVVEQIFKPQHGTRHTYGGGLTNLARINYEICSLLPKRDVIIWAIDVSPDRGKHLRRWGSCIDWLTTTPNDARAMITSLNDIVTARARHYAAAAFITPNTAPIIRVIINDIQELLDESAGSDIVEQMQRVFKMSRAMGISLEMWTRYRGVYGVHGFPAIAGMCHTRTTASEEDNVEISLDDIVKVAAVYEPFRPALDPVSVEAVDMAYFERGTTTLRWTAETPRPRLPEVDPGIAAMFRQKRSFRIDTRSAGAILLAGRAVPGTPQRTPHTGDPGFSALVVADERSVRMKNVEAEPHLVHIYSVWEGIKARLRRRTPTALCGKPVKTTTEPGTPWCPDCKTIADA